MLNKYFIAIVPPEPLLSEIREIKKTIFETYGTKGALRSPAHITLHMPFSREEKKEEKLISELASFKFENAVSVQLKNYGCFEPRVVFLEVIKNEILNELQKQLVRHAKQKLQLFNQSDDMRGFHPHVTVAFRDLKKPIFYKLWEEYSNKEFKAEFTCGSFCLLKQAEKEWQVFKEFNFSA